MRASYAGVSNENGHLKAIGTWEPLVKFKEFYFIAEQLKPGVNALTPTCSFNLKFPNLVLQLNTTSKESNKSVLVEECCSLLLIQMLTESA